MSAAIRFLAVAMVGWVGLRAASLGLIPGAEALPFVAGFTPTPQIAAYEPPSVVRSEIPAIPAAPPVLLPASPLPAALPQARPAYPALAALAPTPASAPVWFTPIPQLDDWPLSRIASSSRSERRSGPIRTTPAAAAIQPARFDRISLTTWALVRQIPAGTHLPEDSLASGGTLGGSQAGMRLAYAFNRVLAASLRTTSTIGGVNGAEVALGLRWKPLSALPVTMTAERRQRISGTGRSGFALFAEGGVYDRPMPLRLRLDAYAQAGVVGVHQHDLFADGALTLTRPVWRRISAGAGVWGGIQPGVYRVDVGPRLSLRVGRSMRVDVDYRWQVAGDALPGSGPTLTVGGDF
jgi:hypothetical protein